MAAVAALLLAAAPAVPPPPAPATLDPARAAAMHRLAEIAVERLGIPGLQIAVAIDGQVAWTAAFGTADLEHSVPVTNATMFRLASLSKPITATAVMQLVERGKLSLDDDARKHCPAFPAKPWTFTVRQLLDHQAGIRDYKKGEWGSTRHYSGVQDALAAFEDDPLAFPPGQKFLYSTYGYSVLGCVIENASGQSYLDDVRANVFAPAGVESIRDDDATALVPGRAPGYQRGKDGVLRNSALADTSNKIPGGGLVGNAIDVARFGAALADGRLVAPGTLARMMQPAKTSTGVQTTAGLGFFITRTAGVDEAWHTGGQPRVSNALFLRPGRRCAVAILSNLEGVGNALRDLARSVAVAAGR